jgi:hypothetical protein
MTSQGSAHGRFTRAIQQRNLWAAETSLRELGSVSLEDALGYLDLLAEQNSAKVERAAVRWHGRLETEATFLTLAEAQLALAALASLCAGERDAVEVLRQLLRRVRRRRQFRCEATFSESQRSPSRDEFVEEVAPGRAKAPRSRCQDFAVDPLLDLEPVRLGRAVAINYVDQIAF